MHIIADLQLHSKFSRAVSKEMTIPNISSWARRKGIGLIATGDWMHPLWMKEIESSLVELGNGLLRLKDGKDDDPQFMLATEVSCIYTQAGKGRRIHTLVWVSSLDAARKINREMTKQGCNLMSDGRPIIGLTSINVAELVFTIDPTAMIIPAHAWTPWFGALGSMSGFDSLEECYGPYAKQIYALETGLSSNPAMNWRIKELDTRSVVSFSDAHSGPKLGREATIFDIPEGQVSYDSITQAIKAPSQRPASPNASQGGSTNNDLRSKIAYTIEFYPEEGKYHYTGHRACNIRWSPEETQTKGTTCPVCGKPLTQGVMQRMEELAGRSEESLKLKVVQRPLDQDPSGAEAGGAEFRMTMSETFPERPPFLMVVALQGIIHEAIGSPLTSPKVMRPYMLLTDELGSEFNVLFRATHEEIAAIAGERVAVGVDKVRSGDIIIDPGYDGVFGVVQLWKKGEVLPLVDPSKEQLSMF